MKINSYSNISQQTAAETNNDSQSSIRQ